VLAVSAACATRPGVTQAPSPQRLTSLEADLARSPQSEDARFRLATAYQAAGRAADAATVLEPVAQAQPRDAAVVFLLALAYEAQDRFTDARHMYEAFLQAGPPAKLKRRARARIALMERRELEQAVRTAIAQESTLGNVTPSASAVGIFPFLLAARDTTLRPLGRALAEMLSTDLAQTERLTVVERASIQFLLDELRLGASQAADPSTAARAGRMLGAGRLVQGRVDGDSTQLRLQSVLVAVGTAEANRPPQSAQGRIQELFDMEKRLALALYADLGIQLTVAERERVLRRHTDNVQALLAFGFGLEADDANRWPEAIAFLERAVQIDGGFQLARFWLEQARLKAEATGESRERLAELAETELGWDLPAWRRRRLAWTSIDHLVPDPDLRNPAPEMFGVEGLDRRGRVVVIIRPPGGN
jgi:tetratricopeptide (TPR) repeat protein